MKRPHYLPQFYLHWFTTTEEEGSRTPTFWVYDKKGGEPRRQTPINTAVESHFYDLELDGTRVPVEEMLAEIESAAKPVLERLSHGEPPRTADIPLLARFLSHMHSRVPRHISAAEESGTILAREMLKAAANDSDEEIQAALEETGGTGIMTVEQVRDWFRNADTHVKGLVAPKGHWLAESLHQAPAVESLLLRMHWSTCSGPQGSTFLTGDTPLCPFMRWGPNIVSFGGGFGRASTEVTFPLSPHACLFITHWHKPEWMPMTAKWVREINRRTAHIAERYVIAAYRSPDTDELVDRSRESLQLPKFDKEVMAGEFRGYLEKQKRERRNNSQ